MRSKIGVYLSEKGHYCVKKKIPTSLTADIVDRRIFRNGQTKKFDKHLIIWSALASSPTSTSLEDNRHSIQIRLQNSYLGHYIYPSQEKEK